MRCPGDGGLWHRWDELADLANIGYPIAELAPDGGSVITKPEGTGGLVSTGTVAEQIVYEIDDPSHYHTPDVDVDFTTVSLAQEGPDRVAVRGALGPARSPKLKVAAVYRDGWTASGILAVAGRNAEAKARAAGALILARVGRGGFRLADSLVECLGAGDVVPGLLRPSSPRSRWSCGSPSATPTARAVERFCREFAPLVTSGPSGIAGYATGRPTPRPAFGYWPALIPRWSLVSSHVEVRKVAEWARTPGVAAKTGEPTS